MKEALKLALEALESLIFNKPFDHRYSDVLTTIKEAMAQPEQNLNCKSVQARLATAWGYVKAEQEPVAEIEVSFTEFGGECLDVLFCDLGVGVHELYAAPLPQRKPLTPEQFNHMPELFVIPPHHVEMVARAIEAAHGIKE